MDNLYDIAIIGAGGAGQMGMLRAVLNNMKTFVFLGEHNTTRKSRGVWVFDVENIPGMFHKKNPITSTTVEVLNWINSNIELKPFLTSVEEDAKTIKKENGIFEISSGKTIIKSRSVLLCTGTMDVQPKIKGSIEHILPFANLGDVYYCLMCDGHRTVGHDVAVIGYNDTAGWIAIIVKERYNIKNMYVLTHGNKFEASDEVKAILKKYEIPVVTGKIDDILGDFSSGLKGFKIVGEDIKVTKAFVALGSIVYNDLAKQLGVKLSDREHIITDKSGETSVEGFYASGDLVEGHKKQVYTAWDASVDAVNAIDRKVRALKRSNQY